MDIYVQALVMGIVQGLTEFLPISSSGHLIIVPYLFGWTDPFITSLAFSVMLHIGTLAALLVYFRADWLRLVPAGLRGHPRSLVPGRSGPAPGVAAGRGHDPGGDRRVPAQRPHRDRLPRGRAGRRHARRRARSSCGWPTGGVARPRASTTSRSRSRSRSAPRRRSRSSRHQPVGDQHLGGPLRRARTARRRPASRS